jgi:hypothetical protein
VNIVPTVFSDEKTRVGGERRHPLIRLAQNCRARGTTSALSQLPDIPGERRLDRFGPGAAISPGSNASRMTMGSPTNLGRLGDATTGCSFCLDVVRFDERPPFLHLRLLEHAERLRALLIQRGNLLT